MSNVARRVLFRADAGLEIGTGHVMRCLTLADAMQEEGVEAVFITRKHAGNIISSITAKGYRVVTLPGNSGQSYGAHQAAPAHAGWLEASWRSDAAATRAMLRASGAEWLVMDHYALDRSWQRAALCKGVRLIVLDDLADRPHIADVLLDQNAGRKVSDYDGLVPDNCDRLIGPTHALLRSEFARLRPKALAKREVLDRPKQLLITLGGIDKNNAVGQVLNALAVAPSAGSLQITVVMGESAPHLNAVRARAAHMPAATEVAVNVKNMAERMLQADLCIGAAGSTAWERCALGLPTLQVVLADNQAAAAYHMVEQKLALALPQPNSQEFSAALAAGLEQLSEAETYRAMARNTASVTDGLGASRLARALIDREYLHAN